MINHDHAKKCILNTRCRLAGTSECTRFCPSYIVMHGINGTGGKVYMSDVPPAYRNITAATSPVREDQPEVYEIVDAYVETFSRIFEVDAEPVKSLYLFSRSPGTGKTTTAVAIMHEYLIRYYIECRKRGIPIQDRPVYFLSVNGWQSLYNEFNRSRVPEYIAELAAESYYQKMSAAKTVNFVVLDDIGVRDASDAFRADLHEIIDARITNELPTVYTSNIPLDELKYVYDERLADRIRDRCVDVHFEGTSKRGMR